MSKKINTGGPAFPVSTADSSAGHQDGPNTWQFPGMLLRDYFAAKAMQGLLIHAHKDFVMEEFAEMAYEMADAMLKARDVVAPAKVAEEATP